LVVFLLQGAGAAGGAAGGRCGGCGLKVEDDSGSSWVVGSRGGVVTAGSVVLVPVVVGDAVVVRAEGDSRVVVGVVSGAAFGGFNRTVGSLIVFLDNNNNNSSVGVVVVVVVREVSSGRGVSVSVSGMGRR
jgi:hypothetical protein